MKKTPKPTNIAQAVATLSEHVSQLASFDAEFEHLKKDLDDRVVALERMQEGVGTDIDAIERQGQDELAKDAVAFAETLDQIEAAR